jgi:hypothetical protein
MIYLVLTAQCRAASIGGFCYQIELTFSGQSDRQEAAPISNGIPTFFSRNYHQI